MANGSLGKALIVEDDALVAMVTEDHLKELGFEPVWVERAADALQIVADGGLSLMVVDIGLPDMRGDELAKRSRRIAPHLPIIVASGYDSYDTRRAFAGDETLAILPKPYSFAELRAVIAELGVAGAQA